MTVRELDDDKSKLWLVEVYPQGRDGPRKRKRFATKGEALAFERFVMDPDKGKPWLEGPGEPTDGRRLSDLVELWFGRHGQSLRDGEARKSKLLAVCQSLGDPLAVDFTARDFAAYREARLSGDITDRRAVNQEKQGVTPNTVNREHAYLRAVFNELKRLGEWQGENPLDGLRAYKVAEAELAFLYPDELKRLLAACAESPNPDLLLVMKLCLATGARWSEVEELTQSQVSPNLHSHKEQEESQRTHQLRALCPVAKKARPPVPVTVIEPSRWWSNGQGWNCHSGRIPTFCVRPSPVTL